MTVFVNKTCSRASAIEKAADFFERTMNELVHDILLKYLSNSTD